MRKWTVAAHRLGLSRGTVLITVQIAPVAGAHDYIVSQTDSLGGRIGVAPHHNDLRTVGRVVGQPLIPNYHAAAKALHYLLYTAHCLGLQTLLSG